MLDILCRKTNKDYEIFCDALDAVGQGGVVRSYLMTPGRPTNFRHKQFQLDSGINNTIPRMLNLYNKKKLQALTASLTNCQIGLYYSCGLSTATIEYSCPSVCLCVSFCVCVCVCVPDNLKNNFSIHLKLEHIVVYENSSDQFDNGHCPINFKVTA